MASSDSRGESEKPNPTNVGGQAVIEGVMMRAPGSLAVVCRRRDGSLVVRERSVPASAVGWAKLPFFRGVSTLVSSIRMGQAALRWSADLLDEDLKAEEGRHEPGKKKPSGPPAALSALALSIAAPFMGSADEEVVPKPASEPAPPKSPEPPKTSAALPAPALPAPEAAPEKSGGGLLVAVPIIFALAIFVALPQAVAEGVNAWFDLSLAVTAPLFQVITGGAKLCIIVGYMSLLRLIPDIRRVFQYHGAEHKAISTYEAGQDLIVENARKTTALHARCGTTFIIMVAFVSVILFSAVGVFLPVIDAPRIVQSIGFFLLKLPLLPVVAGITFEIQRVFARHCSTGPLRALLWPGFLVQKITTAPPDDDQLEVALASLRSALARATVALPVDHPDRTFTSYGNLLDDPIYRAAAS